MNERSDETPQLYKFMGAYGQVRMRNRQPTTQLRSPWIARGVKQYAILSSEDCHPADITHLQRATVTVRSMRDGQIVTEEQPMLVPIDPAP